MIADVEARGKEEVVARTRPVRSTRTVVTVRSFKIEVYTDTNSCSPISYHGYEDWNNTSKMYEIPQIASCLMNCTAYS